MNVKILFTVATVLFSITLFVSACKEEPQPVVEVNIQPPLPVTPPHPLRCTLDDTFGHHEFNPEKRSTVIVQFKERASNAEAEKLMRNHGAIPANRADLWAYAHDTLPEDEEDTGIVAINATSVTGSHRNPGVLTIRKRMSQVSERCPTPRIQWTIVNELYHLNPQDDNYRRWAAGTRFLGVIPP
ncbi:MAG: hypothetical protein A3C15_03415 [Candidatus Magasanikbacteria bacterium RIFCSPHIGHO2_02_FULL_50_9b]|uniref:Inhibitor I9 domain-containing protein n=1 Tax=Candidatus Magasanikbacteria bacterium RIFCSPHIGHO2_02_FULL_50_9b TaxID=1798682 RepID=A0A1F6M977_9BACT|nr:MAG: hypothetical protein A3C15_03415 [Candidatus Magasanikbacteria bacterium RIFCSPHIGHO2_02_FULL_50_9b]